MSDNTAKPFLAIWMVTYNHQGFIEKAIESVMKQQTHFDFKLFIGEDNSTDATRTICKQMQAKYGERIVLLLNEQNLGGRQNAINVYEASIQSGATYLALLEGDDYWIDPLKLQKQVDFLESNPNHSFSWTRFKTYNQDTQEFILDFNSKHFPNDTPVIDFDFETSLKGWHIGTQTMVLRLSFFDLETLKQFKYFKDTHIVAHLLKKGKGCCLNFVGAVYRIHEGGIHTSVTTYNGYKAGYLCHKEIFLDNKTNIFLKKKYLISFQNYIDANIKEGYLFKAFYLSIILFFRQWSIMALLRNFKRIFKKGFSL